MNRWSEKQSINRYQSITLVNWHRLVVASFGKISRDILLGLSTKMTVTKETGFPSRHSNKSVKPRYNGNDGFLNFHSLIVIDVKNRSLKPRKLKFSRTQQSYLNILLIKCTFLCVLCIKFWCPSYAREFTLKFSLGTQHRSILIHLIYYKATRAGKTAGAILACKNDISVGYIGRCLIDPWGLTLFCIVRYAN